MIWIAVIGLILNLVVFVSEAHRGSTSAKLSGVFILFLSYCIWSMLQ